MRCVCKSCGYRFDSGKLDTCPYCGKKNVAREQNADELLDELGLEKE